MSQHRFFKIRQKYEFLNKMHASSEQRSCSPSWLVYPLYIGMVFLSQLIKFEAGQA
jgi:hypothetical protein